jgi:hypothetical protein
MKLDEMLTAVSKLYGTTLDPQVLAMYEGALASQPLEHVRDAINAHVATSPFMPKPADLLTLIRKSTEPKSNWADSWSQIMDNHGRTEDLIGQRALRSIGGWGPPKGLGYVNIDRLPYLQARFQEAYETMAEAQAPRQIGHNGTALLEC